MKRIIVISPGLTMGGIERASSNTINSISNNSSNLECIFICVFKRKKFFKLNSEVELIEPNGFNNFNFSFFKTIKYLRRILKSLNKDNETKILVFGKFYGAIVALALLGLNIEFNLSDRQSPLYKWTFKIALINQVAFLLRPPLAVMAQTSIAASYQKKKFTKSKVVVIPNIIRPITLYPEIQREKVILAVGRLGDHLKGFDLLIESFTLLKNQNWELHIAGGDENGQALKDLAAKLGILDRVKFLGKVKDIDKVYAKAGIFVIPSRSEGFPNALAEAMAAGCCCVAFDFIAGPRDIIDDGVSGIIIENGNIQLLAQEIDVLIENPQKRKQLGNKAIEIIDRLNSTKISTKIIKFLDVE